MAVPDILKTRLEKALSYRMYQAGRSLIAANTCKLVHVKRQLNPSLQMRDRSNETQLFGALCAISRARSYRDFDQLTPCASCQNQSRLACLSLSHLGKLVSHQSESVARSLICPRNMYPHPLPSVGRGTSIRRSYVTPAGLTRRKT